MNSDSISMTLASKNQEAVRMEDIIRELLGHLGESSEREGLVKTPKRVASSLKFLTQGYRQDIKKILNNAVYEEPYDEMVLVKDIEIFSKSSSRFT